MHEPFDHLFKIAACNKFRFMYSGRKLICSFYTIADASNPNNETKTKYQLKD